MNPTQNKTTEQLIHNGLVLEKASVLTSVEIETDIAIWHESTGAMSQRGESVSAKNNDLAADNLIKTENDEASVKQRTAAAAANQEKKV